MKQEPMRILFIAKNLPVPGKGGNPVILELADKLRTNYGMEIDILFPKEWVPWGLHYQKKYKHLYKLEAWNDRNSNIHPVSYVRLPMPPNAFRLLNYRQISLPDEIKDKTYDLIHAHYLLPDTLISHILANDLQVPVVSSIRGSDKKLIRKVNRNSHTWRSAQSALTKSQQILTFNQPMSDYINSTFGCTTQVIPHGIDSTQLLNIVEDGHRDIDIIVVASAIKLKRIDWIIRAFKERAGSENTLVVIGDGPEREHLENLASGNHNIEFTGRIPRARVMKYLSRSKIFALPSIRETFGMAFLEAAAKKNAIIAPAGTGIQGVFKEESEALFVESYEEFADALDLLMHNTEKRRFLAENAYQRATQLSWKKVTAQYFSLYSDVIKKYSTKTGQ